MLNMNIIIIRVIYYNVLFFLSHVKGLSFPHIKDYIKYRKVKHNEANSRWNDREKEKENDMTEW